MINIITQGGSKTDVDTDNMPKIQKKMPKEDMYHPLKQKLFFTNAIEVFESFCGLEMEQNPPHPTIYPNIVQFPTSPSTP